MSSIPLRIDSMSRREWDTARQWVEIGDYRVTIAIHPLFPFWTAEMIFASRIIKLYSEGCSFEDITPVQLGVDSTLTFADGEKSYREVPAEQFSNYSLTRFGNRETALQMLHSIAISYQERLINYGSQLATILDHQSTPLSLCCPVGFADQPQVISSRLEWLSRIAPEGRYLIHEHRCWDSSGRSQLNDLVDLLSVLTSLEVKDIIVCGAFFHPDYDRFRGCVDETCKFLRNTDLFDAVEILQQATFQRPL